MSMQLQQTIMWMSQIMQQRGLTPPMAMDPTPTITPSQIPTPIFNLEIENHDQATTIHLTQKRREVNFPGSLQPNPGVVQ